MIDFNQNKVSERRPYSTKDDILEELAKRTGKPLELLTELYDLHIAYINEKKKDESVINISLPCFSTLRLNYYILKRQFKTTEEIRYKYLDSILKEHGRNFFNFNRLYIHKQFFYLWVRFFRKNGAKYRKTYGEYYETVQDIENFNNEEISKKYKKGYYK